MVRNIRIERRNDAGREREIRGKHVAEGRTGKSEEYRDADKGADAAVAVNSERLWRRRVLAEIYLRQIENARPDI